MNTKKTATEKQRELFAAAANAINEAKAATTKQTFEVFEAGVKRGEANVQKNSQDIDGLWDDAKREGVIEVTQEMITTIATGDYTPDPKASDDPHENTPDEILRRTVTEAHKTGLKEATHIAQDWEICGEHDGSPLDEALIEIYKTGDEHGRNEAEDEAEDILQHFDPDNHDQNRTARNARKLWNKARKEGAEEASEHRQAARALFSAQLRPQTAQFFANTIADFLREEHDCYNSEGACEHSSLIALLQAATEDHENNAGPPTTEPTWWKQAKEGEHPEAIWTEGGPTYRTARERQAHERGHTEGYKEGQADGERDGAYSILEAAYFLTHNSSPETTSDIIRQAAEESNEDLKKEDYRTEASPTGHREATEHFYERLKETRNI